MDFCRARLHHKSVDFMREFEPRESDFLERVGAIDACAGCKRLYSKFQGLEDKSQGLNRGTSLIINRFLLGTYGRTMPRALRWSWGGVLFLMSEVPLR